MNWKYKKNGGKRPGRPRGVTPEIVLKLEAAARIGCNLNECLLYAGIGKAAYYHFVEDNPDFPDRLELLRNSPVLKARENSARLLEDGDAIHTRWYLERKRREEFQLSQSIDMTGSISVAIDDKEKALHDFLIGFKGADSPSAPPDAV